MFKAGDLVISTKGNLGVIINLSDNKSFCSLLWCSTGYIRQGFACVQLRKVADLKDPEGDARQLKKIWSKKEVLSESR